MKISQENMLAEMGDLQIISVYKANNNNKFTDSTVKTIEHMDNVIGVNPKMNFGNITVSVSTSDDNSRYKTDYASIAGTTNKAVNTFGYEITKGNNLSSISDGVTIEALAGEYFAYSLYDTQRPEGSNTIDYWSYLYGGEGSGNGTETKLPDPYVDVLNTSFTLTLGDDDPNSNDKIVTQKFKIVGILKEDYSKGYETSSGLLFNSDDIKKLIKQYNQLNNITQSEDQGYSEAYVKVNDINSVSEVESKIKEMGFSTSSLESIREPMEKEVRQKQLMFAGLGVVSLFVAALGIMNTMIMAISERKREIGVMKALGCLIGDIKAMFLMEAGFIGFAGGVAGLLISLIVSAIINVVSAEVPVTDFLVVIQILFMNPDRVSVIPLWLAVSAVIFSVLVGIASGYYPANKAIKISALDAIRSE